ncbi:MAG: hypothetical protein FJ293_10925 [Planctomycetes bacterium]|nr:hypothetical protein [Planctomycetota bacterium]
MTDWPPIPTLPTLPTHPPRRRCAALLAASLLVAAGCMQPLRPTAMAPDREVARLEPRDPAVLALLDFEDARPPEERGASMLEEAPIGGRWFATDRFWSFHDDAAALSADAAAPPELHARVTGAQAFTWYPYPNHGIGAPRPAPLAVALPDYLALQIEQRALFHRVVRCHDEATALELGADLVLSGRIDHLAGILAERRDPFAVRPDDRAEYSLLAGADFTITIHAPPEAEPLLERRCRHRDDQARLQQELERYRGTQPSPWWQLDAADFPSMALHDLGERTRRALAQAAGGLLAELEEAVAARAPAAAVAGTDPEAPPEDAMDEGDPAAVPAGTGSEDLADPADRRDGTDSDRRGDGTADGDRR